MQINELRRYRHPDISDFVVHFSGRSSTAGPGVPSGILTMKDWERLGQILVDQWIKAFPPFGTSEPVVCFTVCTTAGIKTLMSDRRYTPCGVAFSKDFVFRRGGGPALYVRGDEWDHVDSLPAQLRARVTVSGPVRPGSTGCRCHGIWNGHRSGCTSASGGCSALASLQRSPSNGQMSPS